MGLSNMWHNHYITFWNLTKQKFLALNIFSYSIQEGENILGIILISKWYKEIQEDSQIQWFKRQPLSKEIQGEWEP